MDAIRKIEAALAAGPTEGVWQWHSNENMYGCSEADYMALEWEDQHGAIIETDSGFYGPDEPTRAYIAACNPSAIREVLQTLASKDAEIARLRVAASRYEWIRGWGVAVESGGNIYANSDLDYLVDGNIQLDAALTTQPKE